MFQIGEFILFIQMLTVFYQKKKHHLAKLSDASVIGISEANLDVCFEQ